MPDDPLRDLCLENATPDKVLTICGGAMALGRGSGRKSGARAYKAEGSHFVPTISYPSMNWENE